MSDSNVPHKNVSLADIKKYIYTKLDDPKTTPTSICRAYEGMSGNMVTHESEDSTNGNHTVKVLIYSDKDI